MALPSAHALRQRHRLWVLLPILAALVAYSPSLSNGYAFDDVLIIQHDRIVDGPLDLGRIVTSRYWAGVEEGPTGDATNGMGTLYRPLAILTHALHARFGGNRPILAHARNGVLHALCAALLFWLLARVLESGGKRDPLVPALLATLFAVHPLSSEAVLFAVGVADLLAATSVLAAVLVASSRPPSWRGALLILALTTAGMLAKESAVVTPALLLLVPWMQRGSGPRPPGAMRLARLTVLPSLVAVGLSLAWRAHLFGAFFAGSAPFQDNPLVALPFAERAGASLVILGRYLWLFLSPVGLSADYSFAEITATSLFQTPAVVGHLALLVGLVAAAVLIRRARLVSGGVAWFFVAILPTSNLLFPVGTIMAERLVYLPGVGLFLALAGVVLCLRERIAARAKQHVAVCTVLLAVLLGGLTMSRAAEVKDNCTLFAHTVLGSPGSARAHYGHGLCCQQSGRMGEAVEAFATAIRIYPDFDDAAIQHAQSLETAGDPEQGLRALASFTSTRPLAYRAAFSHAMMLARHERLPEARQVLERLPPSPPVIDALRRVDAARAARAVPP